MADKSVTLGVSNGEDCVICDHPTQIGTPIIEVVVLIKVVFKIRHRAEVHLACAKELGGTIERLLKEAKR